MNHNSLKQTIYSTLMGIYVALNKEYNNDFKSKRELYKILKDALSDMNVKEDLFVTIEVLTKQFKEETNKLKKEEIYEELKTINMAIAIMEKIKHGRYNARDIK